MHGYSEVTVTKGFQYSYLFPLKGNQPAHHNVQQKGGHPEKYHWQQKCHSLELTEFLGDQVMRGMIASRIGPLPAIRLKKQVHAVYHIFNIGPGSKGK